MQLNLNEAFAEDWYVGLGTNFCLEELILENTCIVFKISFFKYENVHF